LINYIPSYTDIKALLEDLRKLMRRLGKVPQEDIDKCKLCVMYRFCDTGYRFFIKFADLNEDNIKKIHEEEGIFIVDLREITKSAKKFLRPKSFLEFHQCLHDYMHSMNYAGVIIHILREMSLLDVWLNQAKIHAKLHKEISLVSLDQILSILPAIYSSQKDPFEGQFRILRNSRGFFDKEIKDEISKATILLRADKLDEFRKIMDESIEKIRNFRKKIMEEHQIAMYSCYEIASEIRPYISGK